MCRRDRKSRVNQLNHRSALSQNRISREMQIKSDSNSGGDSRITDRARIDRIDDYIIIVFVAVIHSVEMESEGIGKQDDPRLDLLKINV